MDAIKVAPNSPTSPLQMIQLFKNASKQEGKLRPLVPPLVLPPGEHASSSLPSSAGSSADNTDNHDVFAFSSDADMRREDHRIKTFAKWPVAILPPEELARNGFYYLGRGDEVRCAFCKVEVMGWEEGDNPAFEHQRWAPQCPFLKSGGNNLALDMPVMGRDECGVRLPARNPGPVHPQYASEASRLRSFKDWPKCMPQKPELLAEAGFFYTGQSDKTKCFYCDGGLKDWEADDIPWEQHARWISRCAYVQLVKGKEFVQRVISEASVVPPPKPEDKVNAPAPKEAAETPAAATPAAAPESEEEKPVEDAKLCKICYADERNVVFVPCGHVVACAKCALSTGKCPMCRRTFEKAVRLYFS